MADLKPCPFCGSEAIQQGFMLRVLCSSCGASTRDFTGTKGRFQREHEAAQRAWNQRADQGTSALHGQEKT